jgi:hypothetical protein
MKVILIVVFFMTVAIVSLIIAGLLGRLVVKAFRINDLDELAYQADRINDCATKHKPKQDILEPLSYSELIEQQFIETIRNF